MLGRLSRPSRLQYRGNLRQLSMSGKSGPCGEEAQKPLEDLRGSVWVPGAALVEQALHRALADTPTCIYF